MERVLVPLVRLTYPQTHSISCSRRGRLRVEVRQLSFAPICLLQFHDAPLGSWRTFQPRRGGLETTSRYPLRMTNLSVTGRMKKKSECDSNTAQSCGQSSGWDISDSLPKGVMCRS